MTTTTAEESGSLAWSPDGKHIAYLLGDEPKFSAYDQNRLAVIPAAGGEARILTASLDRPVRSPFWSADGKSLVFSVSDDRAEHVARIPAAGGSVETLIGGDRVVSNLSPGPDGAFAVIASTPADIPEIYALEAGRLRQLSHQNDDWFKTVQLGATEGFTSTSRDGTEVHGLIVKPSGFIAGRKYPALLRIHGGPNGQDAYSFSFEREIFAAAGYVVVAVNYRGSNGRGSAYQKAIFADWGNKEVVDLLGAMDYVQKTGFVDPDHLGIGGWSYGGILTNYTIATDGRFKAAISGAGSSNQISMYGTDMYINQYENEIGPPWKAQDLWIKISYPFFHADRIKTPTLFMGGEKDFNVPLLGGEQMYQALRSLGVDTRARHLSEPVPRHHRAVVQEGSAGALPRLVRQVPQGRCNDHGRSIAPAAQPAPSAAFGLVQVRPEHVLARRDGIVRHPLAVDPGAVRVTALRIGGPVSFHGADVFVELGQSSRFWSVIVPPACRC